MGILAYLRLSRSTIVSPGVYCCIVGDVAAFKSVYVLHYQDKGLPYLRQCGAGPVTPQTAVETVLALLVEYLPKPHDSMLYK
jgi:hypothetical protein